MLLMTASETPRLRAAIFGSVFEIQSVMLNVPYSEKWPSY